MYLWLAQTHDLTRRGQTGYEQESSEGLKKYLIRMGASLAIGFGGLALAQDLPYPQKPIVNSAFLIPAIVAGISSFRPLAHRARAKAAWKGLASSEINGVEHATRTMWERPPQEDFDSLSLMLPVNSDIPVEDLAYTLATTTNSGTLIVAPSGSGKTMFIRRAQYNAYQHYKGNVEFYGIDCKGDEDGWLGLERNPQRFVVMNSAQVPAGFEMLQQVVGKLNSLTPVVPTIALLDEWNNGISSATKFDKALPANQRQNYAPRMILDGCEIVTKGRSKKVYGWMTTHSPKAEKIGMDPSTRESVNIVILARGNKLGLITSILKGKFDFVDDEEVKDALLAQWMAFRQATPNPEQPIALTNLGGQWRLVQLPDYRQPLPDIVDALPGASGKTVALPIASTPANFSLDEEWDDESDDDAEFEPVFSESDRPSHQPATTFPLPLPRYLATQQPIDDRERDAVIRLYHTEGEINKAIIARSVWNITAGGGRSWTHGALPKIDRILAEYEQSLIAQLERSLNQPSEAIPDPFENLPDEASEDDRIYQKYRHHRAESRGITEFVEATWKVKKPSPEFQQARSKLFCIIQTRLKEWLGECMDREPRPGREAVIYEIWRMENKSSHVWKDADREWRFADFRRLVGEAVLAIEADESASE